MNKKLIDWIKVQRPGPFELNANQPTANVFIADFIELNNSEFCRTVIELNDKILKELVRDKNNDNDNGTLNLSEKHESEESDSVCIESNNIDVPS